MDENLIKQALKVLINEHDIDKELMEEDWVIALHLWNSTVNLKETLDFINKRL